MAAHSIVTKVGDGVTTDFTFSFTGGYISQDDVKVQVNDEVDGVGDDVYRSITFITDGTIRVGGTVPGVGEPVKIFRKTPITNPINDFQDGTVLDEEALDLGFNQVVKAAQELEDAVNSADAAAEQATKAGEHAVAAAASSAAAGISESNAEAAKLSAEADAVIALNRSILADASATASEASNVASAASASASAGSAVAAEASRVATDLLKDEAAASAVAAAGSVTTTLAHRTAAEAAQTAAESSETAAAASATSADTARSQAVTAKDGAELAETGAVAARNAAELAETAAETAETGAVSAQTAAEAARDAAITAGYDNTSVGITGGTADGVVIGGTTPAAATFSELLVDTGDATNLLAYFRSQGPTNSAALQFQNAVSGFTAGDGFYFGYSNAAYFWNYEASDIVFATASSQRAVVKADGKFGIGTASPSEQLEVVGGVKAEKVIVDGDLLGAALGDEAVLVDVTGDLDGNDIDYSVRSYRSGAKTAASWQYTAVRHDYSINDGASGLQLWNNVDFGTFTGNMSFRWGSGADETTEWMRLDADGLSVSGLSVDGVSVTGAFATRAAAVAATVHTDLQTIAVMHDGVLCRYVADALGDALITADARTWAPADDTATFQHWGATSGTASGDQAAAIIAALESGHAIKNRRTDEFLVTTVMDIYAPSNELSWEGGRIVVEMASANSGITVYGESTTVEKVANISVRDVSILAKNGNAAYGLRAVAWPVPSDKNDIHRHYNHLTVENVHVGCYDHDNSSHYFATANFAVDDLIGAMFSNCVAQGPKSGAGVQVAGTHGFLFSGDASRTKARMINCEARSLDTGVKSNGEFEGFRVDGCQVVNCRQGILVDPTTTGYETVGVFLTNNHVNAEEFAIRVTAGAEVFITGNELYRFLDVADWVGVDLGTTGKAVRDAFVTGNTFKGTSATAFNCFGIQTKDLQNAKIADNSGTYLTGLMKPLAGATYARVYVRDNLWRDTSSVYQESAATQTTNVRTGITTRWAY